MAIELAALSERRHDYRKEFARRRRISDAEARGVLRRCFSDGLLEGRLGMFHEAEYPVLELHAKPWQWQLAAESAPARLSEGQRDWMERAARLFASMNRRIAAAFEAGNEDRAISLSKRMVAIAQQIQRSDELGNEPSPDL